jgi:ribonuclease III
MTFHNSTPLSRARKADLLRFEKSAGLRFRSLELLNLAFTHRSFSNEDSQNHVNNERLEFLGDSILGMITATYLFSLLTTKPEGELARIKSFVVSEDNLSEWAKKLHFDLYLLVGKGEEHSGGRMKKAILADAMEAIIGAYYLDSGFKDTEKFVLSNIVQEIEKVLQNKHKKDYKTILQEYMQKNYKTYPKYELVKKTGPDHDRTFEISVAINSHEYGPATGKNKKEAEQNAAQIAYESIIAANGVEAKKLLASELKS